MIMTRVYECSAVRHGMAFGRGAFCIIYPDWRKLVEYDLEDGRQVFVLAKVMQLSLGEWRSLELQH